ncbi:conserved hypothetical protein [Candidatus Zixiibacteriota bacterium]|nr:conserved hypothetical protein [candidate division Zixibacteria bacterium]
MKVSENKKILITVKAYPNPNRKRGETVCCAGVDIDNRQLIRLHPVPFRDLAEHQKFRKYDIISVDCFRPSNDSRPESFSIHVPSIRILDHLDSESGTWKKRKEIVSRIPVKSMCQVIRDSSESNLSLGLVKPRDVSFEFLRRKISDPKKREEFYAQTSLLNKTKGVIEEIPLLFYYRFRCDGFEKCMGHKLSIVDWEICQAYRNWRDKYSKEELQEKIREQWLKISDTSKKDVLYFVGNMNRFRNTFLILGVFYPTKT